MVPDQLLTILRLCLLALLYLFFFRVLAAVWAEIRAPTAVAAKSPRRERRSRRGKVRSLRVIAPPDQRGRTFPLSDELTLGRAAGCQVTVDDTFVSSLHARVFARDRQLFVEDLGSTNGTYLNRKKVSGPMVMHPGDHIQVGNTVLELS